jgi:adenine-specific DNA-methyltransferase
MSALLSQLARPEYHAPARGHPLKKKALRADYDETVWDHLAGTHSAPFEMGEHRQIAVKVIDDRGNELLVVEALP